MAHYKHAGKVHASSILTVANSDQLFKCPKVERNVSSFTGRGQNVDKKGD